MDDYEHRSDIARMQVMLETVKETAIKARKLNPTPTEAILLKAIEALILGWTEALELLGRK